MKTGRPTLARQGVDPVLALRQEVRLRGNGCSVCCGKRWKVAELVQLEKDEDYCKTVKCSEPIFLPTAGRCEVSVVC